MNIIVNQVRKIAVKSITFNWAESMRLKEGTTVSTFKEAQTIIDMLACEYGSNDGYCKTSFTIEWEDGRKHEGRIDVQQKDNMKTNAIGEHVKDFYERCACIKLFHGDTYDSQADYVRGTMKADPKEFEEILNTYMLEDVKEEVSPVAAETTEEIDADITYKLNADKNGVEIYFSSIPSDEIRTQLKLNGFKWSRFSKCWYAKQSENTIALAEQLAKGNIEVLEVEPLEIEIAEFVDVTQFKISEETEKRLIDNSLININKKVGRETEQLQITLNELLNNTIQVIELTDNTYNKNKLINGFNSFCERYTRELNNYLYQRSINPSWAVTGRGGLNVSKYNKKQYQLHNKMGKVVEMLDKQRSILNKYKNQFKREKEQQIKQGINNTIQGLDSSTIEFKTEKRAIEYYGYKYNTRAYISDNYFFMKLAACYRIFENSTGKEVYSMKTADKLTDAKNYVMYLENERMKAVV